MPTIPWRRTGEADPDAAYLVMASQLPLKSIAKVPWFMALTVSVLLQLERTEGVVGYSLRAQPFAKTFWTLSAWIDGRALDAFVRELPHQAAMGRLRPHMGPTRFTTWEALGSVLPVSWDDAVEGLLGSTAISKPGAS